MHSCKMRLLLHNYLSPKYITLLHIYIYICFKETEILECDKQESW